MQAGEDATMNTTGEECRSGWSKVFCAICFLAFTIATTAVGQETITNLAQLAQEAFSGDHSLYLPFTPWQWQAYSTDGGQPFWVDCSALPCIDLLPVSTNLNGVPLLAAVLTKNVLTGETLFQSGWSTDVVARIPAPSGYQPGALSEDRGVWWLWQQWTNCPDCWGEPDGGILPPTVTLNVLLADINDYAIYQSNVTAAAGAQSEDAVGASTGSSLAVTAADSEMMGLMNNSAPCTITNETDPFSIVSITVDTGGGTLTWTSCSDHVYVVQATSDLTTGPWTDVASMWGTDGTTTWSDTNAIGQSQLFYRVVRANPNTLNNAIPYGWAVTYGLDPLDPNLAFEDPDGDCLNNLQEYSQGTDPLNPSPILITASTVYADSTASTASVPNLALHSFSGAPPLGIIQSGTDSNFYGVADLYTVFKMTPQGTLTPLYQFTGGTNGSYPSMPVQANDGNFYGVCYMGGKTNPSVCNCSGSVIGYGTVFRLTAQGILTNLHLFAGPPEGSCPVGGLIQGRDGSFYGVTEVGGSNNCLDSYLCDCPCDPGYGGYGTVFQITPQGTLTTLHTFSGGADGAWPEAALLQGSDGYLYGTTSAGNGNAGTVFQISTDGVTFVTLHAFTGDSNGATPLAALIQDGSGNLYGTTFGDCQNNAGTVFMITTNGTLTTLHNFGGSPDGYAPGAALVQGSDGSFYGTTVWGGTTPQTPVGFPLPTFYGTTTFWEETTPTGNGIVFRITPQGTLTTAYQFSGGADGGNPFYGALVQGADGFLYGTTLSGGSGGAGTVFKVSPGTYSVTYTWSITGGTITTGQGSPMITFTVGSICPLTISVTATNGFGCSNSGSASVTVAAPQPASDSPVNVGQTLTLSALTVDGATYSWTGPDGFNLTNQNPSISNVQPCDAGQYCVSLIAGGCTTTPSCVSVTVAAPPPTNNSPPCLDGTLYLSVPTVAGATYSYSWTGPDGFSSTDQTPSITNVTTNATGAYCVVVAANDCTSTPNCVSVTVKTPPTAIVSNAIIGSTCPGSPVTIQAALTGVEPWIVAWSDGVTQSNVTVSPAMRTVKPYSTTNYAVTALSDVCSDGTATGSVTVTVNTNLTSSVTVSNEVLVVYNSNLTDSVSCADYYINNRPGFSDANVLGCACTTFGVDGFESITTDNLTNQIINPIINFIQSNPSKSIHYVVLMYGMPSRVSDGYYNCSTYPFVQHRISRCMSDVCSPSGPHYEGSTCPFVATNYPGTTCLVTALDMATLADCTAYVDKVTSMYTGDVVISARAARYTNDNYYLDEFNHYGFNGSEAIQIAPFQSAILAANPSASVFYSTNAVITTGSNVTGYVGWGTHNGVFSNGYYSTDGSVKWSGSSAWWIIETIESFNGRRDAVASNGQGDVEQWFASNAWGGTNYANTPVGAVSHVEEPYLGNENGPTYMSLWESGFLFSECAWASKRTACFQAIGDPLIKQ
jgi:uncharacterized repeat protein (TIGR03803 family)